jgi:hypothetical protein
MTHAPHGSSLNQLTNCCSLSMSPYAGSSKDDQEREVTRLRVALSQARAAYNFLRNEYGEWPAV